MLCLTVHFHVFIHMYCVHICIYVYVCMYIHVHVYVSLMDLSLVLFIYYRVKIVLNETEDKLQSIKTKASTGSVVSINTCIYKCWICIILANHPTFGLSCKNELHRFLFKLASICCRYIDKEID